MRAAARLALRPALVVAIALFAAPAAAQGKDAARADALFKEGKELLERGQLGEACPKIAESDALDPSVGALGLLAACHERQGKYVLAWREYGKTAERADRQKDKRAGYARDRAKALEAKLGWLRVELAPGDAGAEVLVAASLVPAAELAGEIPVDPGEVAILVRAPGKIDLRQSVTAAPGSHVKLVIPPLAPAAAAAAAAPPPQESDDIRRPLAFVAGGIGIVALGVGIGAGVSAISQNGEKEDLEATCAPASTEGECAEGPVLESGARTAATISNIGFAVGAAGIAAGVILLLVSDSPEPAASARLRLAPAMGPSVAGGVLSGRF